MPKAALVKKGEECLPGVQLSELEAMYRYERPGNRDKLQAVVLRKQDRAFWKVARVMGLGPVPSTGGCIGWSTRAPKAGTTGRARAVRGC